MEMHSALNAERAQYWARQAIAVQDACNLSGVVYSFAELVKEVRAAANGSAIGDDPFIILFTDKIRSMVDVDRFSDAYAYAKTLKESA